MKKYALILFLAACTPTQEPAQTVINYTDNSQTVQVVGDGNNMAATTDVQTAQTSTPQQTTENTTEDNMYIFWLVVLGLGFAVGLYFYLKKKVL